MSFTGKIIAVCLMAFLTPQAKNLTFTFINVASAHTFVSPAMLFDTSSSGSGDVPTTGQDEPEFMAHADPRSTVTNDPHGSSTSNRAAKTKFISTTPPPAPTQSAATTPHQPTTTAPSTTPVQTATTTRQSTTRSQVTSRHTPTTRLQFTPSSSVLPEPSDVIAVACLPTLLNAPALRGIADGKNYTITIKWTWNDLYKGNRCSILLTRQQMRGCEVKNNQFDERLCQSVGPISISAHAATDAYVTENGSLLIRPGLYDSGLYVGWLGVGNQAFVTVYGVSVLDNPSCLSTYGASITYKSKDDDPSHPPILVAALGSDRKHIDGDETDSSGTTRPPPRGSNYDYDDGIDCISIIYREPEKWYDNCTDSAHINDPDPPFTVTWNDTCFGTLRDYVITTLNSGPVPRDFYDEDYDQNADRPFSTTDARDGKSNPDASHNSDTSDHPGDSGTQNISRETCPPTHREFDATMEYVLTIMCCVGIAFCCILMLFCIVTKCWNCIRVHYPDNVCSRCYKRYRDSRYRNVRAASPATAVVTADEYEMRSDFAR